MLNKLINRLVLNNYYFAAYVYVYRETFPLIVFSNVTHFEQISEEGAFVHEHTCYNSSRYLRDNSVR